MTYPRTDAVSRRVARLQWVLLANASRARLFERDPENGAMRELAGVVDPAGRAKGSDLADDRPGHVAKGTGRTQFEPRTPPKEHEHREFARDLAHQLEAEAQAGRMAPWVLIASSPFLGLLRAALGSAAAARLEHHADRDLTAYQGRDLEHRVAELLPPSASDEPGA